MQVIDSLTKDAVNLLKELIRIPSYSTEESGTCNLLQKFFQQKSIPVYQSKNNIWARNKYWKKEKLTILLNSHHDTVRPGTGWYRDPFLPQIENGKLYGLGSNDAGGPLVSLISTFVHYYESKELPFNLILAATAEEEISGPNGVQSILKKTGPVYAGIVGEPTGLQMAIAEKGLMVVDAVSSGISGHAARNTGENAIYKALEDIQNLRSVKFDKVSELLGPTKLSITQIQSGIQHNVIPDVCKWVIDVRTNEHYTNEQVFQTLQEAVNSELTSRSFRLKSSGIDLDHPLVAAGKKTGLQTFGSPTLSDQALMDFPSIKLGCGNSDRSHSPDEYILLDEIKTGIEIYIEVLSNLSIELSKPCLPANNNLPTPLKSESTKI